MVIYHPSSNTSVRTTTAHNKHHCTNMAQYVMKYSMCFEITGNAINLSAIRISVVYLFAHSNKLHLQAAQSFLAKDNQDISAYKITLGTVHALSNFESLL